MSWASIPEALAELRAGRMILVVDDPDRENEGDLVMAAEKVTPEAVHFMAVHGRGLICVPLPRERAQRLDLAPMVPPEENTTGFGTAFTVSVDARQGITTGISAHDRARTIQVLADPCSQAEDLARPGHVFPLVARPGGVLSRPGHTEAAVDLARLAGLEPVGVICEVLAEDGRMARLPELTRLADRHGLARITVAALVEHLRARPPTVRRAAEACLPTRHGTFRLRVYLEPGTGREHLALFREPLPGSEPALVRVHSECLTGEVLGSLRCDCGPQLQEALARMGEAGQGVLIYLRQEGRGIGLVDKIRAYALQERGLDTVEANQALGLPVDARSYAVAAAILADLGVHRVRLLTNNPHKCQGLRAHGIQVVERVPLVVDPDSSHGRRYLWAKQHKLGHLLGLDPPTLEETGPWERCTREC